METTLLFCILLALVLLEAKSKSGVGKRKLRIKSPPRHYSVNFFSITENADQFRCVAVRNDGERCTSSAQKTRGWAYLLYRRLSTLQHADSSLQATIRSCAEANLCGWHQKDWASATEKDWHRQLRETLLDCWRDELEDSWIPHQFPFTECPGGDCKFCLVPITATFGDRPFDWIVPKSYTDRFNLQSSTLSEYFAVDLAQVEGSDAPSPGRKFRSPVSLRDWGYLPAKSMAGLDLPFHDELREKISNTLSMEENKPGHLYAFTYSGHEKYIKVGFTADSVSKRLQQLRNECTIPPVELGSTISMVPCAKRLESLIQWELQNRGLRRWNHLCKKRDQTKDQTSRRTKLCTSSHHEWFEADVHEVSRAIRFWIDWVRCHDPYGTDGLLKTAMVGELVSQIGSANETLQRWHQSVPGVAIAETHDVWTLHHPDTSQKEPKITSPLPVSLRIEAEALVTDEQASSVGETEPCADVLTEQKPESELQKVQRSFEPTPKTPPNKMVGASLSSSPSPAVSTPDSTFSNASIASSTTDLSCFDGSPVSEAQLMPTTPTKSRSKSPRKSKTIGAHGGQKPRPRSSIPRSPQSTPLDPKELAGSYFAGSPGSSM